jgi:hypothetical protein
MNFREYTVENIDRIVMIREELKKRFGVIDRDLELLLVKAAVEPWGFAKNRQPKGEVNSSLTGNSGTQKPGSPVSASANSSNGEGKDHQNDQKQGTHPISWKQKDLILNHLEGRLGPEIARMIAKTCKPLDGLSSSEASTIIDFILRGGR